MPWFVAALRARAALTIVFVLAAGGCGGGRSPRRLNLLLVTLDTVRADHLGSYGCVTAETPTLDRLAREGLRFESAISAAPLTLPSHATLLSGLLPLHHGVRNNGADRFPDTPETLATRLSSAGYRTGAFVGAFVLDRRFGLSRGFDRYDDEIDRDPTGAGGLEAERRGDVVVDRAVAWLSEGAASRSPFFAWVHLYDAHAPYEPPEPFRGRHPTAPYDGEIAFADAQVARLLDWLDERRESQRTVVAVLADHGEGLGQHGELTHGLFLYEPTQRVPLLIRAPGILRPGRVVGTPVSLADVGPTLAGLLEQPLGASATGGATGLDGLDLSPQLRRGAEPPPRDIYAESEYPRTFGWAGIASLRRGNLKYVAAPRPELYDLADDPEERKDRAASDPRRADLESRLVDMRRSSTNAAAAGMDPESRERLAALGYVGSPSGGRPESGTPERDPKDVVNLFRAFEEANWALQAGRLEAATTQLEGVVSADPRNAVFRGLLAQAWRRRGNLSRAIVQYREAVATTPDDPDVRYNLAVTLQEAGRSTEAAREIDESLRRDPRRPEAHNARGIVLFALGKGGDALAEFDRAADLDPRDARTQNNRGNVLRQLGRFEDAEKAYRRAIDLAPRYGDPLNGLGALKVAQDRPREAVPLFEQALAVAPSLHEARLNRGLAFQALRDNASAVSAYRDFLAATANDAGYAAQRRIATQLVQQLSIPARGP